MTTSAGVVILALLIIAAWLIRRLTFALLNRRERRELASPAPDMELIADIREMRTILRHKVKR